MTTPEAPVQAKPEVKALRLTFAGIALAHVVLLVAQPILAGMSLEGNETALDIHYFNGMAIMTVAVLQVIAGLLWWKPGNGGNRGFAVSVTLLVLELAQFMIGTAEAWAVHIPLGILTLVGAFMAARMGFRSGPRSRALKSEQAEA